MTGFRQSEAMMAAEAERLALEARNIRRTIEHARTEADKRALNRQLADIQARLDVLKASLR